MQKKFLFVELNKKNAKKKTQNMKRMASALDDGWANVSNYLQRCKEHKIELDLFTFYLHDKFGVCHSKVEINDVFGRCCMCMSMHKAKYMINPRVTLVDTHKCKDAIVCVGFSTWMPSMSNANGMFTFQSDEYSKTVLVDNHQSLPRKEVMPTVVLALKRVRVFQKKVTNEDGTTRDDFGRFDDAIIRTICRYLVKHKPKPYIHIMDLIKIHPKQVDGYLIDQSNFEASCPQLLDSDNMKT